MAVQLGKFQLEHPFILAPMAGITNSPFRRLMRRKKSALVISELISANGMQYTIKRTLDLLSFHEEERVVGIQIFGENTENLCKAAQMIEQRGADFVDLNLGCPVHKIVQKGAGSALCRNPIALGKLLSALVSSVKIPVTIKIRTGWDQTSRNALECIQAATDAGVHWVAIHGRTRAQGYSGLADWDFIGEMKAKSTIPILGNGDLTTAEMAVERLRTYKVDAVLIGRGALRNPFIFEQAECIWKGLKPHASTPEDYLALLNEHRELFGESFPPQIALLHVRKFLAWYSSGFPGCHEFRKKIFNIEEPEILWKEAEGFFELTSRGRDSSYLSQPFLMGGHG